LKPNSRIRSHTLSISSLLACCRIEITIAVPSYKQKARSIKSGPVSKYSNVSRNQRRSTDSGDTRTGR
jgi:hypothetical protein